MKNKKLFYQQIVSNLSVNISHNNYLHIAIIFCILRTLIAFCELNNAFCEGGKVIDRIIKKVFFRGSL